MVGCRSPPSARPEPPHTNSLATVPTAADRMFMDGESDAAAVSVALTVREAVRRQRRQAYRASRKTQLFNQALVDHIKVCDRKLPSISYQAPFNLLFSLSKVRTHVGLESVGDWNTMSTGTHRQAGAVRHSPTNPGRPQAGFRSRAPRHDAEPAVQATVRPTAWLRRDLSIAVCPGTTKAWVSPPAAETSRQLVIQGGFVVDDGRVRRLQRRVGQLGFADLRGYLQTRCDAGLTIPQLAAELGVSQWTVKQALMQGGVKLPPRAERLARQRRHATDQRLTARAAELGFADVQAYLGDRLLARGRCWPRSPPNSAPTAGPCSG
jgi:hypothetical protein